MAECGILLHPAIMVEKIEGEGVGLEFGDEKIWVEASCPIEVQPAEWWPDFGVRHSTKRLIFRYGASPCEGWHTLVRR